jgi:two-component system cell cycle response regulator
MLLQLPVSIETSFMVKRVLTIDDSKTMRAIIAKYLSPFSIKILEAENGEQGVDRARDGAPDLILLDYNMPVMDGYHALVELKTDPDLKSIPVVMVTTETEREKVIKLLRLGLSDYISKPFTRQVLLDKLNPILGLYDGTRPLPASVSGSHSTEKPPVLVVEHRSDVLNLLKESLDEDFCVIAAESGNSATDAMKQQHFEFLFLDLGLPDMSAFDVFEAYAQERNDEAAAKRVIAMTSGTADEEINLTNELGFAAVMYEPFSPEEVRHVIKLVSGRRKRSRRMRHLTNHGKVCVLECPARRSSRFQAFVEAMDKMVQEIEDMVEEGSNCLVVRIGEGFLSQPDVAHKFAKVMEQARKRLLSIRLVVESRESRDILQKYEETACLPKDLSLQYSLNAMK